MAWINCECHGCSGCKFPNRNCTRVKEVGPPRSASSRPGLCDECKRAGGQMKRSAPLAEAIITVHSRRRTFLRIKEVVSR